MKFLLDENVHRGLFSFLRKLGHDVKLTPGGSKNGEVFSQALSDERVVITHDWDFTKWHIFVSPKFFDSCSVILLKIPPGHLEKLKTGLSRLLAQKTSPNEFSGKLFLVWEEKFEEHKIEQLKDGWVIG